MKLRSPDSTVLTPVVPQGIMKCDLSYENPIGSLRPIIYNNTTVNCVQSFIFLLIINPFPHSLTNSSQIHVLLATQNDI